MSGAAPRIIDRKPAMIYPTFPHLHVFLVRMSYVNSHVSGSNLAIGWISQSLRGLIICLCQFLNLRKCCTIRSLPSSHCFDLCAGGSKLVRGGSKDAFFLLWDLCGSGGTQYATFMPKIVAINWWVRKNIFTSQENPGWWNTVTLTCAVSKLMMKDVVPQNLDFDIRGAMKGARDDSFTDQMESQRA